MTTIAGSRFRRAMSGPHAGVLAITTLLAWLAESDGEISPEQMRSLRAFSVAVKNPEIVEIALTVIRERDFDALAEACETVQRMPTTTESKFMQWAISIGMSDKKISNPANYVLRFFADLTGVDLAEACRIAKRELPFPGDPSSVAWWQSAEEAEAVGAREAHDTAHQSHAKEEAERAGHQANGSKSSVRRKRMAPAEARAVLGLKQSASPDDIAQAYRRLAAANHPDRFSQAEPEEQRHHAQTFKKIREAFEALTQS